MASPKSVCTGDTPFLCVSLSKHHAPDRVLSCVTPLMYFDLTEASETNRLATEFLKLWSFISLSMKCASVFFSTANVVRLFIENGSGKVGEEISTCEKVFCMKLRPTHINLNLYIISYTCIKKKFGLKSGSGS